MDQAFNLLLVAVMLGGFALLRTCKKRQKTWRHASLYAVMTLVVLLGSCGLFLWHNFLHDAVTDAGTMALERAEMQWHAQGRHMARMAAALRRSDPAAADAILVLHGGMENQQSRLAAFTMAMTANGVPPSALEFRVVPVSGPRAGIAPAESLVTVNDLKKAIGDFSGGIVISLLGVPPDAPHSRFDFTRRGKQRFWAGGDATNNSPEIQQMVRAGRIGAVMQSRPDAPQFGESYSGDPEKAFRQFFEPVYPDSEKIFYNQ